MISKSNMRILCVGSAYWPAYKLGGPIFSSHELNRALVKKGVDVTVYCTNVGLEGQVPLNQEVVVDGVKVHYFEYCKWFEHLGPTGWQFSMQLTRALRENLKRYDFVNLAGLWNYPIAIGAYYCRKFEVPYMITPHGLLFPFSERGKGWKKYPYYTLISKRDIQGAKAIHFSTMIEAEQASWVGGLSGRTIVIPNGVDLSSKPSKHISSALIAKYPEVKDKKILLFLGRLNWIKGLDLLVQSFRELCNEMANVHLIIAGNDDGDGYSLQVKSWIAELGLGSQVTFTGNVQGEEKDAIFACADVFVLPSYSENFANAAAEAMGYGIPVVVSNKVGISRDVQAWRAGLVVDVNVAGLAAGLRCLLNDPELAKEMGGNGKRLVEELYDVDKVADSTIAAYSTLRRAGN